MAQIQTENDRVVHPNHYNWIPGIECLEVVEHFNFNLGSALKYIWRAPVRDEAEYIEDLRKASFYISREIERLQLRTIDDDECVVEDTDFATRLMIKEFKGD